MVTWYIWWIILRFGPPPSYPNLRIPGVNAPLPESASFGYQPGGWGNIPTDESGNPLYGYFDSSYYEDNHIDKTFFGEIPQLPEEEEEESGNTVIQIAYLINNFY